MSRIVNKTKNSRTAMNPSILKPPVSGHDKVTRIAVGMKNLDLHIGREAGIAVCAFYPLHQAPIKVFPALVIFISADSLVASTRTRRVPIAACTAELIRFLTSP